MTVNGSEVEHHREEDVIPSILSGELIQRIEITFLCEFLYIARTGGENKVRPRTCKKLSSYVLVIVRIEPDLELIIIRTGVDYFDEISSQVLFVLRCRRFIEP